MGYVVFSGFIAGLPSATVIVITSIILDSFGSCSFSSCPK